MANVFQKTVNTIVYSASLIVLPLDLLFFGKGNEATGFELPLTNKMMKFIQKNGDETLF